VRHDSSFAGDRPADAPPHTENWRAVLERTGAFRSEVGIEDGASHSGHEPNDLFVSVGGGAQFARLSGLSGFDARGDGRSLASLDVDRDGRTDLVAANANAPLLQVFRNGVQGAGGFIAVRLVGGNRTPAASGLSPRQAIGAVVTAQVGDKELLRELRAGDGLAAQSSGTLMFGLGQAVEAGTIRVRWPSGRVSVVPGASAGSLVQIWEEPSAAPESAGFVTSVYGPAVDLPPNRPAAAQFPVKIPGDAAFTLVTSMATWCDACREEIPDLKLLAAALGPAGLRIVGVPVDGTDTPTDLATWVDQHSPPWALFDPGPPARIRVAEFFEAQIAREAVPSWALVNRDGAVLVADVGTPSISALRRAIAASR